MKLYLSSYKTGSNTEELKKWISGHGNKITIIANAKDQYTDLARVEKGTLDDTSDLETVGFEVSRLDLRDYFGKKDALEEIFNKNTAFYVTGGNTFVLRKAMMLSGFDQLLISNVDNPNLLYAGYSAGICLLSKDMHGVAIMDEPEVDPYNSGLPPIYEGIGFIEEAIIPHFESDHKETESASRAAEYCKNNNISFIALHDGDVIVTEPYKLLMGTPENSISI